ncbi:Reticulocyte-binding protein 2-like protein a [Diplonema papillatum]|nr:Reticulocyte-binding protein 2-like protein a [Diplonema papillatum]
MAGMGRGMGRGRGRGLARPQQQAEPPFAFSASKRADDGWGAPPSRSSDLHEEVKPTSPVDEGTKQPQAYKPGGFGREVKGGQDRRFVYTGDELRKYQPPRGQTTAPPTGKYKPPSTHDEDGPWALPRSGSNSQTAPAASAVDNFWDVAEPEPAPAQAHQLSLDELKAEMEAKLKAEMFAQLESEMQVKKRQLEEEIRKKREETEREIDEQRQRADAERERLRRDEQELRRKQMELDKERLLQEQQREAERTEAEARKEQRRQDERRQEKEREEEEERRQEKERREKEERQEQDRKKKQEERKEDERKKKQKQQQEEQRINDERKRAAERKQADEARAAKKPVSKQPTKPKNAQNDSESDDDVDFAALHSDIAKGGGKKTDTKKNGSDKNSNQQQFEKEYIQSIRTTGMPPQATTKSFKQIQAEERLVSQKEKEAAAKQKLAEQQRQAAEKKAGGCPWAKLAPVKSKSLKEIQEEEIKKALREGRAVPATLQPQQEAAKKKKKKRKNKSKLNAASDDEDDDDEDEVAPMEEPSIPAPPKADPVFVAWIADKLKSILGSQKGSIDVQTTAELLEGIPTKDEMRTTVGDVLGLRKGVAQFMEEIIEKKWPASEVKAQLTKQAEIAKQQQANVKKSQGKGRKGKTNLNSLLGYNVSSNTFNTAGLETG